MGFRGIDPEGLGELGAQLAFSAARPAALLRPGVQILSRWGHRADAASLQALCHRVSTWGDETADALRWRVELIRTGQNSPENTWARLRADFAATGVFPDCDPERAFQGWLESRQRVDTAVANITHWLDQRWNDFDVTNNDLHNIRNTLEGLAGDELDRVVGALSPRQLRHWIEEMGHSINGFSRDEKRRLFAILATNANSESLGKIHDAVLAGGSEEDIIDLGMAIQVESPDQVIVDFVAYVMATDLPDHRFSTLASGLAVTGIEDSSAAAAAARAIVTTDGALHLMIVDGLIAHTDGVDVLGSVVDTICRGADPVLIARAFHGIADIAADPDQLHSLLDRRYDLEATWRPEPGYIPRNRDAATVLLDGSRDELLTDSMSLLLTDASGVITELATTLDPEGIATTGFLYQLVDRQRFGDLALITNALRGGNAVDPVSFAERGTDAGYPFPQAQNLAYLAGTLTNALGRYADDAKNQVWIVGTIAIGLASALAPVFEGLLAIGGEAAWDLGGVNWPQSRIDHLLDDVSQETQRALQPNEDNPISVPEGDLAWQAWMSRFRAITQPR
ncbi:MAG: hypothetical protein WBV06_10670 [Acidimicrobiia bacterium]